MTSLLSVLFVASSASGSRLLFSYPPNPTATPRVQRPLYGKTLGVRDVQSRSSGRHTDDESSSRSSRSSGGDEYDDDDDGTDEQEGLDMFGSRFIRGESSSSSSSEDEDDLHDEYDTRELRERESYKVHLGLDTDVLGDLLCPRKALCNKRFEMVINHLAFIAHPASSRSRRHQDAHHRSVLRTRNHSPYISDEEDYNEPSTSTSGLVREGRAKRPSPTSHTLHLDERGRSAPASALSSRRTSRSMPTRPPELKTSRESSLSRSGTSRTDLPFHPTLHHAHSTSSDPTQRAHSRARQQAHSHLTMSLSNPHEATPTTTSASTTTSAQQTPSSSSVPLPSPDSSQNELESWAIVLVIDCPPEQHLSYHLGIYYRDVIVPLMAALKHEERRTGYVTKQAANIAGWREKARESGVPLTPHIEQMCEQSDLCAQLAALFNGLKSDGMAKLVFNDEIEMSVLLHTEYFNDTSFDMAVSGSSSRPYTPSAGVYGSGDLVRQALSLKHRQMATPYDNHRLDLAKLTSHLTGGLLEGRAMHIDIAPWQTLLPLQEPERLLREIDSDNLLTRFLEIMSPSLTFTEYETLLDTDSHSIIEIAEHLIYWRKARLIDAISLKSIYVPFRPTSTAAGDKVKMLARWSAEYGVEFPDLPSLPRLLAILSTPQPFEGLLVSGNRLRSSYLDALTWLLQKELLIQLKVHMNLIATPEIKRAAYEKEEAKQKRKADSDVSLPEDDEGDLAGEEDARNSITSTSPGDKTGKQRSTTNDSNFTISSSSSRGDEALSSTEGDPDHTSATRSPLPRSFPNSYPYMSAASAAFASKPTSSRLHNPKNGLAIAAKERRVYLASLNAPSIISNPSEPTAEEELWIKEIISQVETEKGSGSTTVFQRMLPYVDGSHHLDEILYRAGLSRRAVRTALSDYEGFIISFIQ